MLHYRCRCGKRTAFGSMPPDRCRGCPECGTTLDLSPEHHQPIQPHNFRAEQVETDDGPRPLTRCSRCGARPGEPERWKPGRRG